MSTLPKIGDIVMSPHEKYIENGVAKFDQLDLTLGFTVNGTTHPELYSWVFSKQGDYDLLAVDELITGLVQYRIIADLTEEV